MIDGIVTFLVTGILNVISFILGVIFYPIYLIITSVFPDMTSYWETALDWYTNNLLDGIAFMRETFFIYTGFPRELFNLIIGFFALRFTIYLAKVAFTFIINAWGLIKGGKSNA